MQVSRYFLQVWIEIKKSFLLPTYRYTSCGGIHASTSRLPCSNFKALSLVGAGFPLRYSLLLRFGHASLAWHPCLLLRDQVANPNGFLVQGAHDVFLFLGLSLGMRKILLAVLASPLHTSSAWRFGVILGAGVTYWRLHSEFAFVSTLGVFLNLLRFFPDF